jgi:poly(hydroxyalkanoate) granule-associated protein
MAQELPPTSAPSAPSAADTQPPATSVFTTPILPGLPSMPAMPTLQMAEAVKDSAQQIWLAGLGAFAKAHEEGGKVFESLVKEGLTLQRKTQATAEERLAEATSKITDMATGLTARATGQWDKLETIFEDRVAKALNRLGMPSAQDLNALVARIEALEAQLAKTTAADKSASSDT